MSSAAMNVEHPDIAANREAARDLETGKFGEQQHLRPVLYPVAVGEYAEVTPKRGSFQYPEGNGFTGELDDYLDFFDNVMIPEPLVRGADLAYQDRYWAARTEAHEEAVAEFKNDDDYVKHAMRMGQDEFAKSLDVEYDKAEERANERHAAAWPVGPRMSLSSVRTVLRVAQMVHMRGHLKDPSDKQRVLDREHTWPSGRVETYDQIYDRFHVGEWSRKVL